MIRYLGIFLSFVRFGFSRAMEFRFDLVSRVVMDCCFYAANILFFEALLLHSATIGGWDRHQAMLFVATFIFCDAVVMTFFSNNNHSFPTLVNQGQLDYYLTRPVSPLFVAQCRDFAAASFANLMIAAGILVWAFHVYPGVLHWGDIFLYALGVILGCALWQGMAVMLIYIPVFWAHSVTGLIDLNYSMHHLAQRPDGIYQQRVTRLILTTVMPYAVMASFPTRILLGDHPWQNLGHMAAVAVGLWALIGVLWQRGLKAYASASS